MNRSSITSGNVFPWPCFFTPSRITREQHTVHFRRQKKRNRLCNYSNFTLPNCSLTNHCIIRAFRLYSLVIFFPWTICLQLKNATFYELLTKAIESLKEKKKVCLLFLQKGFPVFCWERCRCIAAGLCEKYCYETGALKTRVKTKKRVTLLWDTEVVNIICWW